MEFNSVFKGLMHFLGDLSEWPEQSPQWHRTSHPHGAIKMFTAKVV